MVIAKFKLMMQEKWHFFLIFIYRKMALGCEFFFPYGLHWKGNRKIWFYMQLFDKLMFLLETIRSKP